MDLPTWLTFHASVRTFQGTPAASDAGVVSVKVTVSDGKGGSVSDVFDITVEEDTTPPTLTSATVPAHGGNIFLVFTEFVSGSGVKRPPDSAFTVTADGIALPVFAAAAGGTTALALAVDVRIRQGQVVVITYTDPTTGDDAKAIQDTAGNDAASFTTGMNSVPAVTNGSTRAAVAPNAPTGLTATASGADTINLSWTAPVDNGGSVITGYKIEVSTDSETTWSDLVANTAATTTTYEHTGLAASTTRHYRVSAINSIGTGTTASDVASATTGTAANATPTVANDIPDQTATAGTAFTYQFPTNTFNDTDTSDTLSYTATKPDGTNLPTWLTFTAGTRTFAGTPASTDVETVSVEVTATDTSSATVSDEFDIVVNADPNAGICARTASVRDALLAKITGVTDCALVTDTHLAAITGSLLLDAKSITALAAGDFDGLTALTTIDLSDNSLTALPAGVFDELTALLALGLNGNSLTGLPADVFDKLTALRQLFLNGNSLTGFPAGVFDELTALTELYLNGNSLTALPADVFDELTALTLLYLHGNSLTALPAGVFDELTALLALGLNDNSLTALPAGVFDGLTALTELDLDTNSLTALPDDVFDKLTSLTSLDLSGNTGAPFSPTAVALPDDGTVPAAGGTVMLDGSGSGGAWGTNVTYGWALTTPTSGVTVTFDDAASAEPTVTIPQVTAGTDLVFTLTVTGRADNSSTSISTGTDTATVTPTTAAPTNATPTVVNVIPDQTATAGTAFTYQFPTNTFNDTDTGDTLSYMATKPDDTALPTWLTFNATTRTFTGTPAATDVETVAVKVTATDTSSATVTDEFNIVVSADTTPPTLTSAVVHTSGLYVQLEFSENLQTANLPAASAFTVTADGSAVTVTGVTQGGGLDRFLVSFAPALIRQGQAVVVTYTDPTAGDDPLAAQDPAGNDAASFTTGMNSVPAVTNSSTRAAVAPGVPTGLTATASGTTRIDLSWTAPADNGGSAITGYKIEVSSDSGSSWTDLVADTTSTATTYEHTGLAASTTRHYRVSAINSIGTGTASDVVNTTTDAATATAPGAPTGLTATASGSSIINLSWTAPASTGGSAITGYKIEISPNGTSSWTDLQANTAGTTTTHEHRNLAASTTRHYRVSAINGIGTSISSDVANATTGAATAPGAPRSLTATASGTSTINLSWTAPASTGGSAITGYKIEISSDGGSSWTDQVADTASTTTTYEHTGLAASTTRHYRVSAINSIGTSATSSNVANATTAPPATTPRR